MNCCVWAFKPTRGMISRSGVIPLSSSFDTVGVIARNPETIKALFSIMLGQDPDDSATEIVDTLKESFNERTDGTNEKIRLGILIGPNDNLEELRELFSDINSPSFEVEAVFIPRPISPTFEYKKISSIDIRRDLTNFLRNFAGKDQPHSFEELVQCYRNRPESHPFGMDRLEDAFQFKEEAEIFVKLVEQEKERANQFIERIMAEHKVQFLVSSEYVDWWSIGGGPTMTFPRKSNLSEDGIGRTIPKPDMFMIGGKIGEDLRVLDFVNDCFFD